MDVSCWPLAALKDTGPLARFSFWVCMASLCDRMPDIQHWKRGLEVFWRFFGVLDAELYSLKETRRSLYGQNYADWIWLIVFQRISHVSGLKIETCASGLHCCCDRCNEFPIVRLIWFMYIYNIIWINDHCRYCSLIVSFLFQLWVSKLRLEISNKKMSLFPSKILATHAVLENVVAGMPSRGNPLDPPLPGNRGNVAMISIPAKSLRLYRYKKNILGTEIIMTITGEGFISMVWM